jgi:hypothetical protein
MMNAYDRRPMMRYMTDMDALSHDDRDDYTHLVLESVQYVLDATASYSVGNDEKPEDIMNAWKNACEDGSLDRLGDISIIIKRLLAVMPGEHDMRYLPLFRSMIMAVVNDSRYAPTRIAAYMLMKYLPSYDDGKELMTSLARRVTGVAIKDAHDKEDIYQTVIRTNDIHGDNGINGDVVYHAMIRNNTVSGGKHHDGIDVIHHVLTDDDTTPLITATVSILDAMYGLFTMDGDTAASLFFPTSYKLIDRYNNTNMFSRCVSRAFINALHESDIHEPMLYFFLSTTAKNYNLISDKARNDDDRNAIIGMLSSTLDFGGYEDDEVQGLGYIIDFLIGNTTYTPDKRSIGVGSLLYFHDMQWNRGEPSGLEGRYKRYLLRITNSDKEVGYAMISIDHIMNTIDEQAPTREVRKGFIDYLKKELKGDIPALGMKLVEMDRDIKSGIPLDFLLERFMITTASKS